MAAARRELSNHQRRRWQPADPSTVPEIGKPISGFAQDDSARIREVTHPPAKRRGKGGATPKMPQLSYLFKLIFTACRLPGTI
jgi:hypothetical protein